jgi:SAM-dependent methyltransferase
VHTAARAGFSAGVDSYVRGRPAYGEDTLADLGGLIGEAPGWIADVGAGTGALSSRLAAHGHAVLAVEPLRAMLERCPPGPVRVQAAADALPLATGSLGAVTVATAFHWFSTAEALDEIHRCLRPDGVLVLLWNDRDNDVPWVVRHTELVDAHAGDTPRFKTMRWRQVIDAHPGFREISYLERANPTPMDRDALVDRVMSTSFIGALPPEQGAKLRSEAEDLAATLPEQFDYPYITRIWAFRPVPAGPWSVGQTGAGA